MHDLALSGLEAFLPCGLHKVTITPRESVTEAFCGVVFFILLISLLVKVSRDSESLRGGRVRSTRGHVAFLQCESFTALKLLSYCTP